MKPLDVERFWSFVDKSESCWNWGRGVGGHGYGQFYVERGKPLATHRLAWTLAKGAIPLGLQVLHRCDNKRCVRPEHLFLGTQLDNIRDMDAKGRSRRLKHPPGEKHPTAKLSDAQVAEIRRVYVVGTRQNPGNAKSIAARLGVTTARVYQLANGKSRCQPSELP